MKVSNLIDRRVANDAAVDARSIGVDSRQVRGDSVTLSARDEACAQASATAAPYIVVLLECHRPAAHSSLHRLDDTAEVLIGRGHRGDDRAHDREVGEDGGGRLSIAVPDRWMSSRHARLVKRFGRWYLEDLGSKNGTVNNGVTVSDVRLGDGDIFEAGRTLFLFRNASLVPTGTPRDHVTSNESPELTTLSPALAGALEQLVSVARAPLSVTLTGETGSGKEVVARALHRLSGRSGPFVALNCGAIPASLVESELFGYVRGAFSGADADREGTIRAADGGTLFLDEIAEMPASSQAALLRVLQEREVVPVGASRAIPVDVRVLAATHQDLRRLIANGGFRADLFARLAGFEFALPSLRDRREDIGFLLRALLGRRCDLATHPGISVEAARLLFAYDWPLNVRELDNTIAAAVAFAGDALLEVSHMPAAVRAGPTGAHVSGQTLAPLSEKDRVLRAEICELLRANGGNVSATARELGKDRKQIQRWLKRFAIDAEQFRRT